MLLKNKITTALFLLFFSKFMYADFVPKINLNPSLIAYWDFNEGTGRKAMDNSFNSHTFILSNKTLWGTGQFGQALLLRKTQDYAETMPSTAFSQTSFSVSVWFYLTYNEQGNKTTIIEHDPTGNSRWGLFITEEKDINFKMTNFTLEGDTILSLNYWHHIVGVYKQDAGVIELYLDGELLASSGGINSLENTLSTLRIGASPSSTNMGNRKIDDLRLYNKALSTHEVNCLYRNINLEQPMSPYYNSQGQGEIESYCTN